MPSAGVLTLPLFQLPLLVLSQDEFIAVLQRYLAGQSTPAEQHLLDQWLSQPAEPRHPALTVEELGQVRAVMWQRIEEAINKR